MRTWLNDLLNWWRRSCWLNLHFNFFKLICTLICFKIWLFLFYLLIVLLLIKTLPKFNTVLFHFLDNQTDTFACVFYHLTLKRMTFLHQKWIGNFFLLDELLSFVIHIYFLEKTNFHLRTWTDINVSLGLFQLSFFILVLNDQLRIFRQLETARRANNCVWIGIWNFVKII